MAAGIAAAAEWRLPWVWIVAGLVASLSVLLARGASGAGPRRFFLALLVLVGAGRYFSIVALRPPTELHLGPRAREQARLFGEVVSEPEQRANRLRFVLRLDSIASAPAALRRTGRVQVVVDSAATVRFGDYLALDGRLSGARDARNPGEFDYARYLERRDIGARFFARADDVQRVPREPIPAGITANLIIPLRARIYGALRRYMPQQEFDLLLGLLFGERRGLSAAVEAQFQNTGTLHLLAVSGGNVAVVITVIWGALGFVRLRPAVRRPLVLIGIFCFAQLSYNEPSVLRASVAAGLATLGLARHRPVDPLNVWGGALLLLLLWEPRQLFEVGFQLSFLAALGILVGMPLLGRARPGRSLLARLARPVVLALGVSFAAQLAVIPIMAAAFNQVPLVTPLSNLLAVPLAGLSTAAGLVTLFLAPFGGFLHKTAAAAAWISVRALLEAVAFFDGLHFPQWYPATPSVFVAVLYYGVLGALWLFASRARWRRPVLFALIAAAAACLGSSALHRADRLEIVHLDLGAQGCSVLRWPDGKVWFVLSGDQVDDEVWSEVVTPFLRRRGWRRPDVIAALGAELDLGPAGREWPQARLFGGRESRSRASTVSWPPTPEPYRFTAQVDGRGCLWALALEAPDWNFTWYLSHYDIDHLPPPPGKPAWAALPALPWDYERFLAAYPGLSLLECAYREAPPSGPPDYASRRVWSVLTSGAVVTSGTSAVLIAEPSIR